LGLSVEWHGDGIRALSLSERAVLPNMMAEMGCKNSYIAPDEVVFEYLAGRARRPYTPIYPDMDALYLHEVEYAADQLQPMIACPHSVDRVVPVSQVAGTHVDQAFIGTCTNARLDDLAAAAEVLAGRRIARGTRLIIIPVSAQVYLDALKAGYIQTFVEAGAVIESPGCGPCMGNHMGVPAVGEVTISSANRNFQGRMGTKDCEIYLASPAVVAASAVAGEIRHPKELL
jgi:3-isopropylmalate/(R)-2-methylmalate dehydratase large subunit